LKLLYGRRVLEKRLRGEIKKKGIDNGVTVSGKKINTRPIFAVHRHVEGKERKKRELEGGARGEGGSRDS